MIWTNDPVKDAERWLAEQENRLELLPHCVSCGEPIQQDKAVCVDGNWYCDECELDAWADIRKNFLQEVEI